MTRATLQARISTHGASLVIRHLRDLKYATERVAGSLDRAEFVRLWNSNIPADHFGLNAVTGAWDNAMNDLNEVLRAAHEVLDRPKAVGGGRRPHGPDMPEIYDGLAGGKVIAQTAARTLKRINRVRNDYTHRYPTASPERVHEAVGDFQVVVKSVVPAVARWLAAQGYSFPGTPTEP